MQRTTSEIPSQVRSGDIVKDSEGRHFLATGEAARVPEKSKKPYAYSVKGYPILGTDDKGNYKYGPERFFDLEPEALVTVTYDDTETYV